MGWKHGIAKDVFASEMSPKVREKSSDATLDLTVLQSSFFPVLLYKMINDLCKLILPLFYGQFTDFNKTI